MASPLCLIFNDTGVTLMNQKHNLLLTILVVSAAFTVNFLTGDVFNGIADAYLVGFLLKLKAGALSVLGAVLLKKTWIYRRFDLEHLKCGWTAGIPELLFTLLPMFALLANRRDITAGPDGILFFVLEMICVGINEETLFRGLLQNAFHEFFGEDTRAHVTHAVVCAGLCFGAIHLTNALKPGISPGAAAIQALNACGAGIFFGAVYFRTGKNLWYNVLIHALHDVVAFIAQGALSGVDSSAVISQASQKNSVPGVVVQAAAYTAVGLFLLRRKKVEPLLEKPESEIG